MKLWTIQSEEAYQLLQKNGFLRGDRSCIMEKTFIPAYDWLVGEMSKRVGTPPDDESYPIWAWYQWEGKRKRRDLRRGGYAERGTPLVQLTIEIPDESVLLSDFDEWTYPLSFWYLPLTEQENKEFEAEYEKDGFDFQDMINLRISDRRMEKYHERIIQSWQRIFDIWKEATYSGYPLDQKSIQATFWELRIDQVLKVEHFIAK